MYFVSLSMQNGEKASKTIFKILNTAIISLLIFLLVYVSINYLEAKVQLRKLNMYLNKTAPSNAKEVLATILDDDNLFPDSTEEINIPKRNLNIVLPGTRWCGVGFTADNVTVLGEFQGTDKCCREHDMCHSFINPGETKFGLRNNGLFVKSHCDCDQNFFKCLKNVNNYVSRGVGLTFFTIVRLQCYKESHPIIGCAKKRRGRCIEYKVDETSEKLYQWFDNPVF